MPRCPRGRKALCQERKKEHRYIGFFIHVLKNQLRIVYIDTGSIDMIIVYVSGSSRSKTISARDTSRQLVGNGFRHIHVAEDH